jgi:Immunoglobulin domain
MRSIRSMMVVSCAAATLSALPAFAPDAFAQCAPPMLNVTGTYSVNGVVRPALILAEGQAYTFNVSGVSSLHPLILTSSTTGGTMVGQLSPANVPGYTMGGTCNGCAQSQFTITPGPSTPTTFFYNCHVHAGLGNSITIRRKPTIVTEPSAPAFCAGGMLMLDIAATIPGGGTPTYQWRKNAAAINGATTATLMVHNLLAQDSGSYDCVVTNQCASTTSQPVVVQVCPADLASGNGPGCDGGVDINDLLQFLIDFENGTIAADLDNDAAEPQAPDGGVDINDLLYFLFHFEAGC